MRGGATDTPSGVFVRVAFGRDNDGFGEMKRLEQLSFDGAVTRAGVHDFDLDDALCAGLLEEARHHRARGLECAGNLVLRVVFFVIESCGSQH